MPGVVKPETDWWSDGEYDGRENRKLSLPKRRFMDLVKDIKLFIIR